MGSCENLMQQIHLQRGLPSNMTCNAGWLAGWLAGCWLAGWLAGCCPIISLINRDDKRNELIAKCNLEAENAINNLNALIHREMQFIKD